MNDPINIGLIVLIGFCVFLGIVDLIRRSKRRKDMDGAVEAMTSAKRQEMRHRFLPEADDMEYVFLVLSEKSASDDLTSAWRKLADRYRSGTRERVWATELLLASMPMFLSGEGTRHLVWAIIQVGRETISVKIRHLELYLLEPRLHQVVSETTKDLASALKKRKHEVSIAAVKNQPDLASLTVVPIN